MSYVYIINKYDYNNLDFSISRKGERNDNC